MQKLKGSTFPSLSHEFTELISLTLQTPAAVLGSAFRVHFLSHETLNEGQGHSNSNQTVGFRDEYHQTMFKKTHFINAEKQAMR